MTEATETTPVPSTRLEERLAAVEKILVVIPAIVAGIFLVLSLFVPFATTEVDDEESTESFFGMVMNLFALKPGEDVGAAGVVFVGALMLLIAAIICSIVAVATLMRAPLSMRASGFVTVTAVFLVLGTAGAWVLVAMGENGEGLWVTGPALPFLTLGTITTSVLAFLPAYRSIWAD